MPTERLRHERPYTLPEPGTALRVAFVGQATYFAAATPSEALPGLTSVFVDYRGGENVGELRAALDDLRPHAVVVFRPGIVPHGLFADLDAAVLGIAADPLPRAGEARDDGLEWNLAELCKADPADFDRVLGTDPLGWDALAGHLPAWRCLPLPVADRYFRPVRPPATPPRVVFLGHSSMHRELFLLHQKHQFDIGHYAFGLLGDELERVLAEADIGINLHAARLPLSFEHNVLLHLAAGHLLISEPLAPTFGLEPDIDYLEALDEDYFDLRIHQVHQHPEAYHRVRVRGRTKAEQYRASRVWPALIADLFDDLAAFGTRHGRAAVSPA